MSAPKQPIYQVFVISGVKQKHQISSELTDKVEAFKLKQSWLNQFPSHTVKVYKLEEL